MASEDFWLVEFGRGMGYWSAEQKRLSEAGIAPDVTYTTAADRRPFAKFLLIGVAIAMSLLIWKAIVLQQRWNSAPDVSAKIIAVNPPPPEPFPVEYTLGYTDPHGGDHEVAFRAQDIYGLPAIGEEITIRFLPEAPEKPLSHARFRDVGFDFAVPYGIAIFATYWILNLVIAFVPFHRWNPSRKAK